MSQTYRERNPKPILKISEKFKETDDIKIILQVEKHRELQHQLYKDNLEKDKCWDAVGAALGITCFLNICLCTMSALHVKK